jgi:hypothetical protein
MTRELLSLIESIKLIVFKHRKIVDIRIKGIIQINKRNYIIYEDILYAYNILIHIHIYIHTLYTYKYFWYLRHISERTHSIIKTANYRETFFIF